MIPSAQPLDPVVPTVSLKTSAARTPPFQDPKIAQQPSSTQTVPSTLVATTVTPTLTQHVKKETSVSRQRGAANGTQRGLNKLLLTGGSLPLSAQGLEPGNVCHSAVAQMKTTVTSSLKMQPRLSQTATPFQLRSCQESLRRRERTSFATASRR